MTKTKSRILTALALTTALTAPALIAPMFTAPAAIAAPQVVQDFSDLAAKVTPAVVNVAVTMKAGSDDGEDARASGPQDKQMEEFMQRFAERFGQQGKPQGRPGGKQRPQGEKGQAVGTGFIVDAKGTIVTNYHVVSKADSITVTMSDGTKLPAKMLGGDEKTDLAVLKVESDKALPFVTFGDASKVRVGQAVMAVGNPFGLGGTVRRQHRAWFRHPVLACRPGRGAAQGQRPGRARIARRPDPAGDQGDRREHVAEVGEGRPGGHGPAGQPRARRRHQVG